ncbi:MAG: sugar phosphate isomerase/epimerase family protein [Candidatus Limnocylindrales bacterium]
MLGINQILWTNDDLPELTPAVDWRVVLDEMQRLGYAGTQLGRDFARGPQLAAELAARALRIAEVYVGLPCGPDGPTPAALALGRVGLAELHAAGGDVLVAAPALAPERILYAGRAQGHAVPRLTEAGNTALARLLDRLATEAAAVGHPLVFHAHAGTYVETPDEIECLLAATDAAHVGICLDVGHHLVGGGDPVAAIRQYGSRIRHVHLKDVDPGVLQRMRAGACSGFLDALRERVFTEVGSGTLDVDGVLEALAAIDYHGWLVVEQDTTWRPPAESAAMSMAVVRFAQRRLATRTVGDLS